jgi:thioredoxin-like negative regulator of GroEL
MKPPVFVDLDLADAIRRAQEEKKVLVAATTAAWSGPCKFMDRTTWVDPKVVAVLSARAIAIQIDVDEKPDEAKRLKIEGMPTVVLFENGTEIDRVVGVQNPEDVLLWLERGTADRWEEVARRHPDPVGSLRKLAEGSGELVATMVARGVPEEELAPLKDATLNDLRNGASRLARIFRAAGRVDEAKNIEDEARRLDPSEQMAKALVPKA